MIIFKTIEYKNILSVGNISHKINFIKTNQSLIIGKNGSGKSTLLDALIFVLYGKAFRKIKLDQLVNSINRHGLHVTLEFQIGNTEYRVIRGVKPDIFEIWVNGKLKPQEAAKKDYQKFLESNILKMSETTFRQIVILGSTSYVPFMRLNPGSRREIIENLLDIRVYGLMNAILKNRTYYLSQEYKDVVGELKLLKNESEITSRHIKKLMDQTSTNKSRIEEKIAQSMAENVLLEDNIKEQTDRLLNADKIKVLKEETEKSLGQFAILQSQINSNLVSNRKSLEFFRDNSLCPTCKQDIEEGLKEDKIAHHGNSVKKFEEGLTKIEETIKKAESKFSSLENDIKKFKRIGENISALRYDISTNDNMMKEWEKQLTLNEEDIDIEDDKRRIIELKEEISKKTKTRNKLSDTGKYYSAIVDMLKDSGIKTSIINSYLPFINKLIRKYLDILEFNVDFRFDEKFNEVMKSRHRDKFSYGNFSEGEKMRIDLALLFVWRELARKRNSAATNLLIMDEIGDSSLDSDGFESFMKIIGEDKTEQNIFIISHKGDIMSDKFTTIYNFTKRNNFSEMNT